MKPKLRFKEFNSDWNTYKFYELVTIKNGQVDPNDEQYRNLPHIGPGNIEKETGRLLEYNLAKDDKLVSSKYLFDKESVIYGKINPHFAKVCYPKFVGLCSADAYPINPIKDKLTSEFLLYLLLNPQFTKFATSVSMRTGMPKINRDELSIYKFTIPEIAEQFKIGNMLTLLDKKIELQSKKIEDLKLFKKGLIHQMKKSNNNWSEYKISEIFKITRGVVIPKTDLLDNKTTEYQYPVYSSQTSNNGILGYDTKFDFDGKYLTWTTDGANAGKVFYRNGKFRCTNVCGVLYNDNNKYVDELTAELLNYETPKHVSYVGNPKLMNNVMGDIKIFLPDSNESDRVSNILLIINNKVLLETDKLNKLNKLKKGLMQKMFV
jgi:type I restriction enzyme S subunit